MFKDFTLISIFIRTSNNEYIPSEFRNIGAKGLCLKWDNNSMFVAMTPGDKNEIYTTYMLSGEWKGWKKITPQTY